MRKRGFSIFAKVFIGVLLVFGSLSSVYADSNVVYSLGTDADLQTKAVGYTFEGTTWLIRSGDPALTLYDAGGAKGIKILGRDQDWDCIDLRNLDSLSEGADYTIKVTGSAAVGAKMKLSQGKSPWGTHLSLEVGSNGAYVLEKTFTYDELQKEKAVRIQTEGTTGDFSIASIDVIKVGGQATVAYTLAEDADLQTQAVGYAFEGTTWFIRSGDPALTLFDKGGVKGIKITGRDQDWDCIDLRNLNKLPEGFNYTIKVTGSAAAGAKMKLAQGKGPWGTHMSLDVGSDGAYILEKTFTYDELQAEKTVRIQTEGTTGDFVIETVQITQTVAAPKAVEPVIVYSLATDKEILETSAGTAIEGSTWLQQSGSPSMKVVENADGLKYLRLTGRKQDWDCVDLKNLTSLPKGFDYTIKVTGRSFEDIKMKLSQPASPWATHVSQVVGADGRFTLEKAFTYDELQKEKAVRIQSEGTTSFFSVEGIDIIQVPAAPSARADTGVSIDPIFITFNASDKAAWGDKFSTPTEVNVSAEWVSSFGKDDNYSLKGVHLPTSSDYTGAMNAIRLTFAEPLAKNAIYTISYDVFVPAEGNITKGTLTGPGFVLNGDYAGASGVVKFPVSFGTIDIGSWKSVSASTPAEGLEDTLKSIDLRFVINEAPKHPDVWYIDKLRIEQKLISVVTVASDYKEYAALKDVYKDYFLVGTTSSNSRMKEEKLDIIKYHFNSFTPENEMKPSSVQNVKGVFTYDSLDQQLAKVPGFSLVGHTLAWHSQSPSWMWGAPTALSASEAKANMDAHITEVLGRYGAKLYSIDVVNEAFADGKNNADWRDNLRDNEGWFLAMGSDWIENAFLKAAEIIDAKGLNCKLYYNDYNLDYADKAKAVYNMVKELNQKYAGKRPNGKVLIEGIGMQAHYNENTSIANVEESIKLFSSLPGVSISVTELDITYANTGSLNDDQINNQAVKYAELFDLYKKYAAGSANGKKGRIERVTFWGTNDADSWRGASFPLLFDKNLRAKEAFKALLDTGKYLSTHSYVVKKVEGEAPKPVDGIFVWDTDRGDSWSGANIILGTDAAMWPWSIADVDGKLSFTPEKDASYRLTINYTARGTNAIRVRWIKDNTNGAYTKADAAVVNNYQYSPGDVAVTIPAYFNKGMANGETYSLVTEIKLDGTQAADGLIGNIAIRGGLGGNAFTINSLKIEKIGDGADKLLATWPK